MVASRERSTGPTVVLVHGAWHGAWCWARVVEGLAAAGVDAVAVDLPGHGDDPGPFSDLHGDAAHVRSVLDDIGRPTVLVGHSYGGAVVSEAGDHPSVRHLVYLAALAVDAGESCLSVATGHPAGPASGDAGPGLTSGFQMAPDGTATIEASVAAASLYNDCDAESIEWALARLGPQPLITLQQEAERAAWRTVPSTYVVCGHDRAVPPGLQRTLAQRCTTTVEWATDHSAFLSAPALVVELLWERVQAAAGRPSGTP